MKNKCILFLLLLICLIFAGVTFRNNKIIYKKYSNRENYDYYSMSLFINGEEISFPKSSREFILLNSELRIFLDSLIDETEYYQRGSSSDGISMALNYDNDFFHFWIAYSKNDRKVYLQVLDKKGRSFVKYYDVNTEISDSFFKKYYSIVNALK